MAAPGVIPLAVWRTVAQDKSAEVDRIFSWVMPGMPGCVAAASVNGTLVVNRAYGLADLERNVALTPDSVFDAASLRKQFVAAAILMLVEEKRLSLAEDVRRYVPELPDYNTPTLRSAARGTGPRDRERRADRADRRVGHRHQSRIVLQ